MTLNTMEAEMAQFEINNRTSGLVLGVYEAANEADALDEMARGAGYENFADACFVVDNDGSDMIVRRVD